MQEHADASFLNQLKHFKAINNPIRWIKWKKNSDERLERIVWMEPCLSIYQYLILADPTGSFLLLKTLTRPRECKQGSKTSANKIIFSILFPDSPAPEQKSKMAQMSMQSIAQCLVVFGLITLCTCYPGGSIDSQVLFSPITLVSSEHKHLPFRLKNEKIGING